MIETNYILPDAVAADNVFSRSACLVPFAPGASNIWLATGDYQSGYWYFCDGASIAVEGASSGPLFFGSWIYNFYGGQVPVIQPHAGMQFFSGAQGSVQWVPTAFTGNFGLQLSVLSSGGILGFNQSMASVIYTVQGTELFSVRYYIDSTVPDQIEIRFYESTGSSWHSVYLGVSDNFGFGGTCLGNVPNITNQWLDMTFTASQLGVTAGMVITGMAWGVWKQFSGAPGPCGVIFSDSTVLNLGPDPSIVVYPGFIDGTQDGNTGFYLLEHNKELLRVTAPKNAPTSYALPVSSVAYTGVVYDQSDTNVYILGMDGSMYELISGTVSSIAASPTGVTTPARWLYSDGPHLYSLFPNSNEYGTFNIATKKWSFKQSPFDATLDSLFYSDSLSTVVLAGSNNVNIHVSNNILGIAYATADDQLVVLDSSSSIGFYTFEDAGWQLSQTLTGPPFPVSLACTADGLQALVSDTVSNQVQVFTSVGGTWALTETIGVSGPTDIETFAGSGFNQFFVCETLNNTVAIYDQAGINWTLGQVFSITNPIAVAINQTNTAVGREVSTSVGIVATSGGVEFMLYNGSFWRVAGSVFLNPAPAFVATDSANQNNSFTYAAGVSGGNTTVYIFNGLSLLAQYTFTGVATALTVVNYQIVVLTQSGALNIGYYASGATGNAVNSLAVPSSGASMAWVPKAEFELPMLVTAGRNDIWTLFNSYPQEFDRITDSKIAILNGGLWTTVDLKDQSRVSSITTDSGGNIFAVTVNNNLHKITGSAIVDGYPYVIPPPQDQQDFVTLGFSKLVWLNNTLYTASSLAGGIARITNLI